MCFSEIVDVYLHSSHKIIGHAYCAMEADCPVGAYAENITHLHMQSVVYSNKS